MRCWSAFPRIADPRFSSVLAALLILSGLPLLAQSPILSEFKAAADDDGLTDADGDASDWIELFNPTTSTLSLAGWHLTDDAAEPAKWTFPAVSLPAQGFLVVFASGKNRTNPAPTLELHTNFKLDREGEYLALHRPDGTAATEFNPTYPRQFGDASFGTAMSTVVTPWVAAGASARWLVPVDDRLGRTWTQPGFDDGTWSSVTLPAGYDRPAAGSPEGEEPTPEPVDITLPGDFIAPTSLNSPANEGVLNAIDNNTSTKYLNFDKLNAGFTVTPAYPRAVVSGLRLTSANDAPERDPASFLLSGSADGQTFVEIARGSIPAFSGRFTPVVVSFANTTAYAHYRLLFPTLRNAAGAVAVQIAEVEFLGWPEGPPPELGTFFTTDVGASLYARQSGAYLRLPFNLDGPPSPDPVRLRLRYDDGFVAYLNGTEVARANAPATLAANSAAVTNRLRRVATLETTIDLGNRSALLRAGANVLALHALNSRADSRDFLVDAQLEQRRVVLGQTGYLAVATPGAPNVGTQPGYVEDPIAVPERGFYTSPTTVTLSSTTPGAVIRYTTNGTPPSATNGLPYIAPILVQRTTLLRAAAFKDNWRPSRTVTHSYLFLAGVAAQSRASALAAGFPANWLGEAADYAVDPRVVGPNGTDAYGGKYARAFTNDLAALPSVSIVMPTADLFGSSGIYPNATDRSPAWERAASIEWLDPSGAPGFQENAGLRIQGGAFRSFNLSDKKSFRVVFREKYGATELRFPLFGPDAAERFDNFVLRANSNDAWSFGGSLAVYIRDAFAMETARALGMPASHTRFVHLYLNGLYWGIYNPVERPDAAFSASYLGGDKDDWDSINQDSAPDGNYDAWNRLMTALNQDLTSNANYQRLQGNNPDGTRNPAYEDLVEVDNLIDYFILNLYVGNLDWPGRNWWAGRPRTGELGFTFRPWDTETALDFGSLTTDVTGVNAAVARPYAALRANAEFRLRFADHVYRHFYHGGPLFVNAASTRWDPAQPSNNVPAARFAALADTLRSPIVGESARWGDQLGSGLKLRDEHWQKECDNLLANYFPRRSAIVLDQFRAAGLYPRLEPPVMNQHGGVVPAGFLLTLGTSAGKIYYTTNGADPRLTLGTPQSFLYSGPVPLHDLRVVKTRALDGTTWSALNEATFVAGLIDVGITEIHYHPAVASPEERAAGFANADDFEFVELQNRGTIAADLAGTRFTAGIAFDFTGSAVTRLAPGQRVIVVRNAAAFHLRYGPSPDVLVAGEYTGRLDNSGERLLLVDAHDWPLSDVTYGTAAPWPAAADGTGPSLEVLDPGYRLDLPANWRASTTGDGTPGRANSVDSLEFRLDSPAPGYVRVQFTSRAGRAYVIQARESLTQGDWQNWQSGPVQSAPTPVLRIYDIGTNRRAMFFRLLIP